jgi:hypothetical protein
VFTVQGKCFYTHTQWSVCTCVAYHIASGQALLPTHERPLSANQGTCCIAIWVRPSQQNIADSLLNSSVHVGEDSRQLDASLHILSVNTRMRCTVLHTPDMCELEVLIIAHLTWIDQQRKTQVVHNSSRKYSMVVQRAFKFGLRDVSTLAKSTKNKF